MIDIYEVEPELTSVALRLAHQPIPIAEAMASYLEACHRVHASAKWAKLARIDYGADLPIVCAALGDQLQSEPIPDPMNALWFGSRVVVVGWRKKRISALTLSAFAEPDVFEDWGLGPMWEPSEPILESVAHSMLFGQVGRDRVVREMVDHAVRLAHAILVAAGVCRSLPPELLLAGRAQLAVGAGLNEDGEVKLVGGLTSSGFGDLTR